MDFSARLYQLRRQKGISQEALADVLGISRQAVQKWESGASMPDLDNLAALCDYFSVTLDYLVRGQEPTAQAAASPTRQDAAPAEKGSAYDALYFGYRGHRPYEYKSDRTLFGLPLVHIHLGRGLCRAKGIIAIGNTAVGIVSFGFVSVGVLSIGLVSVGLISLACLALGLLGAAGALAVGGFAMGGVAVGLYAFGGLAVGKTLAVGGLAVAQGIGIGDVAQGVVALGRVERESMTGAEMVAYTKQLLPQTRAWILRLIQSL